MAAKTRSEQIRDLRDEATTLKARLEEVNSKLLAAISSKSPSGKLPKIEAPLRHRVLVIEDEDETRRLISRIIGGLGHEVETASNGLEGLNRVSDFKPEIAIVDLALPAIDGYEVARRIRSQHPTSAPILVACTAYSGATTKATAYDAGFDHFWVKPVSVTELMLLLQSAPPKVPEP